VCGPPIGWHDDRYRGSATFVVPVLSFHMCTLLLRWGRRTQTRGNDKMIWPSPLSTSVETNAQSTLGFYVFSQRFCRRGGMQMGRHGRRRQLTGQRPVGWRGLRLDPRCSRAAGDCGGH
jgi:hypothetical protein